MGKTYHVYILASGRNGTLYTGVTGDLARRAWQHRNGKATHKLALARDWWRLRASRN